MHEAILWTVEDGRIRCAVCPLRCRIAEGATGSCGVRAHRDGALYALTYGRVSSVAADPIEKKPVYHYRPGTKALSLGSVGCNMKCLHCQNWQISRAGPDDGPGIAYLSPGEVPRLASGHDCAGVAFTYNEPVIWIEYVLDVARAAHDAGLYTVMVTNGYATPESMERFSECVDVWRVDVKGMDDETYRRLCRVPHADPVLESAVIARGHGMHVEVVTNVVPGYNDDEGTLSRLARWIHDELGPETPWHVTRFFPYLKLSDVPATPLDTLRRARAVGEEAGLHHVFLGNVPEAGTEDTTCPECGAVAVSRDRYRAEVVGMDDEGRCARCGAALGVVTGSPGRDMRPPHT